MFAVPPQNLPVSGIQTSHPHITELTLCNWCRQYLGERDGWDAHAFNHHATLRNALPVPVELPKAQTYQTHGDEYHQQGQIAPTTVPQ
jgi:hypothetical protein